MLLSLHPSPALACSASTSHLRSLFSTVYDILKVNLPLTTEQAGSLVCSADKICNSLKMGAATPLSNLCRFLYTILKITYFCK